MDQELEAHAKRIDDALAKERYARLEKMYEEHTTELIARYDKLQALHDETVTNLRAEAASWKAMYEDLLTSDARVIVTQARDVSEMHTIVSEAYALMLTMDEQRMALGLSLTEGVDEWKERARSVLDRRCWTCGCPNGVQCVHLMCFDESHANRRVEQ